jgi:uncharacterized protein (TIGR03435 family)
VFRHIAATGLAVSVGLTAIAQVPGEKESVIEVVSIRPTPPGTIKGTRRIYPNRLDYRNQTLSSLILGAMGGAPHLIVGTPEWVRRERFDVQATTRERLPGSGGLLREVLETRFALKWHHETRPLPVFALVRMHAETLGPGLAPIEKDCTQEIGPVPIRPCVFRAQSTGRNFGETTWSFLLGRIRHAVGAERHVVDHTGLSGSFDVNARWSFRPNDWTLRSNDGLPSIFTAVRVQLGLRLERRVEPVEVVVIDSIERPTPD